MDTLSISFNESVLNSNSSSFPLLKAGFGFDANYLEEKGQILHSYFIKILSNSVAFFSDISSATSLQSGFRYENAENCQIEYGKTVDCENKIIKNNKCCITLNITKSRNKKKMVSICSTDVEDVVCTFRIKSFQKLLENKCTQVLAIRELNDKRRNKWNKIPDCMKQDQINVKPAINVTTAKFSSYESKQYPYNIPISSFNSVTNVNLNSGMTTKIIKRIKNLFLRFLCKFLQLFENICLH